MKAILFLIAILFGISCSNIKNLRNEVSPTIDIGPQIFRKAHDHTCLILVYQFDSTGSIKSIMHGSGTIIRFRTRIGDRFFCLTANHVVKGFFDSNSNSKLKILLQTRDGRTIRFFGGIDKIRPVWWHNSYDLAILMLPKKAEVIGADSILTEDIPYLNDIAIPDSIEIGTKVYMLGYKYLSGQTYNYVFKEGIVASLINQHPSFGNAKIFYIDQMANKGMSGGSVYLANGTGLGVMVAYLTELGSSSPMSEDLTVVVPHIYIYSVLKDLAFREDMFFEDSTLSNIKIDAK